MKNILITGGGGYIGTNLTNRLLNDDYNVTVLDTFWRHFWAQVVNVMSRKGN